MKTSHQRTQDKNMRFRWRGVPHRSLWHRSYMGSHGLRTDFFALADLTCFRTLWIVTALCFLAGCASSAPQRRIEAFSEATGLVTGNVVESFNAVEKSYFKAQVSSIIAHYDPEKGFDVRKIEPFLGEEPLNVRVRVLNALSEYARLLAEIMSDERLQEFDEETKAFGETLIEFKNSDGMSTFGMNRNDIRDSEIAGFTTGVNAIGRWMIEFQREKEVRQIVDAMDPHVARICDLLSKDIGTAEGPGLRAQLARQYWDIIGNREMFIADNHARFSPHALWEELTKLAEMRIEQERADAAMGAVAKSLGSLRETHGQLVKAFEKKSPGLESRIRGLAAEAKRVKEFYGELKE
jgi:hypothetical protein